MKTWCAIFIFFALSISMVAQDNPTASDIVKSYADRVNYNVNSRDRLDGIKEDRFLNKLALSFGFSTMGFGLETITPLSRSFMVRAGVDYMPGLISISKNPKVSDDVLSGKIGGYYPNYAVDFKPSFFNGHIYLDYYPMRESSFHFVGGLIMGGSDISAKGELVNPDNGSKSTLTNPDDTWPTLIVEGYKLNIDNGDLNTDIRMGGIVKPYFGIGFGKLLSDSRWNVNFDLGIIYQGSYSIRQNGKKADKIEDYESSAINIKKYTDMVKVLPMMNLQVTYRLF